MTPSARIMPLPLAPVLKVPRWRRRLAWIGLVLCAAPYLLYYYFTDDEYICRQAVRVLSDVTDGEVRIGAARFALFAGVRLDDVHVLTPPDGAFNATAADLADREIFSASSVQLIPDPWALLVGRLVVRRIIASTPSFTIVYNADTDRFNWNQLFRRPRPATRGRGPTMRPVATLRAAQVRFVRLESGLRQEASAYTLDADAWPDAASDSAFEIDYRVYSDMPHRIRSLFDPRGGRVSDTPFVPYAAIRQVLPSSSARFLDQFQVQGRCRVRRLDYRATPAEQRLTLEFRDVSVALPLPMPSTATGPLPPTSPPLAPPASPTPAARSNSSAPASPYHSTAG